MIVPVQTNYGLPTVHLKEYNLFAKYINCQFLINRNNIFVATSIVWSESQMYHCVQD